MKEKTKKMILLVAICLVTLLILFIAIKLNENRQKNIAATSQMGDYLTEIKYDEISNHVVEQPNTIVYVSNSSEKDSSEFEKLLKPVIKEYNLENIMSYININETNIADQIYQYAPELVFYKDGQMTDIIDCTTIKDKDSLIKELTQRGFIND